MVDALIEVSACMALATATSISASQDGRIRPPLQSGWSGFSMLEIFHRPVPARGARGGTGRGGRGASN